MELNREQESAVEDFTHNLLVLAAAGSGKTRVITEKMVKAIREMKYPAWSILAITFTSKAAEEMRKRISSELTATEARGLGIRTFHSLGRYILSSFYKEAGLEKDFLIADSDMTLSMLQELNPMMDREQLEKYASWIAKTKDAGIGCNDKEAEEIAPTPSYIDIWKEYEKLKNGRNTLDFSDLIYKTNMLLKNNGKVRKRLQNRFRLIMVDEYQDSNKSQFEMLDMLTGPGTQLMVVGDDDQSIYGFRGAVLDNILAFDKTHGNVRIVRLEKNYRSTDGIIDLAAGLIRHNTKRHEKTMKGRGTAGEASSMTSFCDENAEARDIASEIRRNGCFGQTAVLYRLNAQSAEFEKAFVLAGIPFRIDGADIFYERDEIKDILAYLRIFMDSKDMQSFRRIANKPDRGLDEYEIEKICSSGDIVIGLEREIARRELAGADTRQLKDFLFAYRKTVFFLLDSDPGMLADSIMDNFNLMSHYEQKYGKETLDNICLGFASVKNTMMQFGRGKRGLSRFFIFVDNQNGASKKAGEDSVRLATIHSAKGQEFDTVYLVGLEDGLLPYMKAWKDDEIEEERRIFYVGITRARKNLHLSTCRTRRVFRTRQEREESRFLDELDPTLLKRKYISSYGYDASYAHRSDGREITEGASTPRRRI